MAVFVEGNVKQNYFNGEAEVPFSATMGEVEVLYGASDKVKEMGETGELKALHDKVAQTTEAAESQYIETKDRLSNILDSINAKEDEITADVAEEHELTLSSHSGAAINLNTLVNLVKGSNASVDNLNAIQAALAKAEDKSGL